ncbi:probable LRR receptor-like serine/threonine-protein kinase At1g05700 [Telopea speciosissima]|uniref:probable LRR receptor-like serine/threonine-protein kinase At1g05700 n=1 Tax=Telopea speciosissima TaxID=54955 RepID=UPI001CC78AFE|nr:probable LRR receptor-like serine/threonine-protein kinase At1g05700 [Telopea speciosissima]
MANNHLFFFLLLSLHAIAASAQSVYVSIDCGSSSSSAYKDDIGITWTGDGTYINTGENKVVQTTTNSISKVMSTLRVFSTRKKNCYSIPITKGTKVLVRASFYYGNYDKKSSPPSFDVLLDGNLWSSVDTSISSDVLFIEAILVERSDSISVCLAQTQPNQFPFISALEVRSLESTMYPYFDSNYALLLRRRNSFGANQTVRSPDDIYDRIWVPEITGNGLIPVTSSASTINTTDTPDNPPIIVLQNAITTADTSIYIELDTNLPNQEVPVYMNLYFSDVDQQTQLRSFNIDVDSIPSTTDPVTPQYAALTEASLNGFNASSSNIFTLVPTIDSLLPPLINAMEVFVVAGPLTNGTNTADVEQLKLLQIQFSVLAGWSGDPCLPSPYTWDWVNCSSDDTPRITALYLNGYGLSGTLPDFSSMDALQTIDLHNNSFTGDIPSSLANLPNLVDLNLANNELSGSVPTSLSQNKKLKLNVSGNKILCATDTKSYCQSSSSSSSGTPSDNSTNTTSSSSKSSSSKLPIILGVTIPAFIIFIAIVAFLAITSHKRKIAAFAKTNAGQTNGSNKPSVPPPQREVMPPESKDVENELPHHDMEAELSDLMDQHTFQHQYDGRSPNPLLHKP